MVETQSFIQEFPTTFPAQKDLPPWQITKDISNIIAEKISQLGNEYEITDNIAIHKTATIEKDVVMKGPIIIGEKCFIAANAYLRGGVYLGNSVVVGPACEIKASMVFSNSCIAHFNFIGDSLIGSDVNFEAGAVVANHYNDRDNKRIFVFYKLKLIDTETEKFGALVGDQSKIGANAVLSPGTLLLPKSVVRRLELVDQNA